MKKKTNIPTDCDAQTASRIDQLESYLSGLEAGETTATSSENNFEVFNQQLDSFEKTQRQPAGTKVIEFWRQNQDKYPIVFETAMQIFSISPTQVSVEELFSTVAYILSPARTSLTDEHLNDIILIRQNKQLHDSINEQALMKYRLGQINRFVLPLS